MTAAADRFPVPSALLANPSDDAWLVDSLLSDSVDQTTICVAFRVGTTAGNVKVTTKNGTTLIIPGVQVGELIRLRVTRFWTSSTTAAGIMAYGPST